MNYEIGKTYELHGQNRRVIGIDGAMRPITELSQKDVPKEEKPKTKAKE
jgi:hypothetical protein